MTSRASLLCAALLASSCGAPEEPEYRYDDLLRLNHIQAKGTHNSYCWVEIPDGTPSRCNPLIVPDSCTPGSIEHPGIVSRQQSGHPAHVGLQRLEVARETGQAGLQGLSLQVGLLGGREVPA